EGVHDRHSAEHIDFKLTFHRCERQYFERAGRENSSIANEEIEAGCANSIGYAASPALDALLVGNVANAQRHSPTGGLLKIGDFTARHRGAEDPVTFGRQAESDIPTKTAAG